MSAGAGSQGASPYSVEATLPPGPRDAAAPHPGPAGFMSERPAAQYRVHPGARFFRRGPWENIAVALISIGIVMLMQPFALILFTWSFATILAGTVLFVVVSHFPD